FLLGILTTVPVLFGYTPAVVVDEQCECHGAPACVARLRWELRDDAETRAARAELQARVSDARLDELQQTVAELVSGDGLERVLSRVMDAARRAVLSSGFVLDVRPSGASGRIVRSEGIDPA